MVILLVACITATIYCCMTAHWNCYSSNRICQPNWLDKPIQLFTQNIDKPTMEPALEEKL